MLSTELIADATEKIEQKYTNIQYFQDQVVLVDNEKSLYDQGISALDTDVYNSIEDLNNSFIGVQSAYQDRINVGCRTDMFWRVVGYSTDTLDYTVVVTQLSVVGYSSVGIGTSIIDFLNSDGSITQYNLDATFGVQERKFYGLKYYDEPYARDIGDTFITSFIGTIAIGSNKLTVMNPIGAGTSELFQVGQIVTSSKDGVFPVLSTVKITGIGTASVN
jgi:ribosomal protein S24E